MSFPQGIYFRATDNQTDPTDWDAEVGSNNYTSPGHTTDQGNKVGWESGISRVNRDGTTDVRLKGVAYNNRTAAYTYRIDLPATGDYKIDCALGDDGFSHPVRLRIYDDTTLLLEVVDGTAGADEWYDGSGTLRQGETAWVNNHTVSTTLTFSSTICRFTIGETTDTGDTNTVVAAVYVEEASASGTTVSPPQGDVVIDGKAPTASLSGGNTTASPPQGDVVIDGKAPVVDVNVGIVSPGQGDVVIDGKAPTVELGGSSTVAIPQGNLTIEGFAPTLLVAVASEPEPDSDGGAGRRRVPAEILRLLYARRKRREEEKPEPEEIKTIPQVVERKEKVRTQVQEVRQDYQEAAESIAAIGAELNRLSGRIDKAQRKQRNVLAEKRKALVAERGRIQNELKALEAETKELDRVIRIKEDDEKALEIILKHIA